MFCVYLAELGQLVVEKNSKMGKTKLTLKDKQNIEGTWSEI